MHRAPLACRLDTRVLCKTVPLAFLSYSQRHMLPSRMVARAVNVKDRAEDG